MGVVTTKLPENKYVSAKVSQENNKSFSKEVAQAMRSRKFLKLRNLLFNLE